MPMKYIGRTVEIIYQDRHGKLSQRRIVVRSIRNSRIRAYDVNSNSYRVFRIEGILAIQLMPSA